MNLFNGRAVFANSASVTDDVEDDSGSDEAAVSPSLVDPGVVLAPGVVWISRYLQSAAATVSHFSISSL